jgi:hypothetical protein
VVNNICHFYFCALCLYIKCSKANLFLLPVIEQKCLGSVMFLVDTAGCSQ